MERNQTYRK
jgi:hypothetical protein